MAESPDSSGLGVFSFGSMEWGAGCLQTVSVSEFADLDQEPLIATCKPTLTFGPIGRCGCSSLWSSLCVEKETETPH